MVQDIDEFSINLPIKKYVDVLNLAREISESQDSDEVCISCFSNLFKDNDLFVDLFPIDSGYVYEIQDPSYIYKNQEFRFMFAVKYEEND